MAGARTQRRRAREAAEDKHRAAMYAAHGWKVESYVRHYVTATRLVRSA
jgi:hypothetical protein